MLRQLFTQPLRASEAAAKGVDGMAQHDRIRLTGKHLVDRRLDVLRPALKALSVRVEIADVLAAVRWRHARRVIGDAGRTHRLVLRLSDRVGRRDQHADLGAEAERIGIAVKIHRPQTLSERMLSCQYDK
ncbi:MAG: hypothetical protein R3C16_10260 [Hyphomonadaceae bacterium]